MKGSILKVLCFLAATGLGQPLSAAPAVHLFEAPPGLPLEGPPPTGTAQPPVTAPPAGASQPASPAPEAASSSNPCSPKGRYSYRKGITTVHLDFMRGHFQINNPSEKSGDGEDQVELRSYGGCSSGPAVWIDPGTTLRFYLDNKTNVYDSKSAYDPSCLTIPPDYLKQQLPPGVGCFDTTNLHTHGLHVSPAGNSDNVLLNINPGTQFLYEINIPADHWAGTFWYHAHRHGSTAVQVASGASGMLIVHGTRTLRKPTPDDPRPMADIDTVLRNEDGKLVPEKLFLFQQIAYACFDNTGPIENRWQNIITDQGLYNLAGANSNNPPSSVTAPWICPPHKSGGAISDGAIENFALQLDSPSIWDTNGRFTSINGLVQPVIEVPAGQIQRWRFAHAGIHDAINVQVVRSTWPDQGPDAAGVAAGTRPLLVGNKKEQMQSVLDHCKAAPGTLVPQLEVATDGVTRDHVYTIGDKQLGAELQSNYLQPGYRSDVLVAFPKDGLYCLLDQAAPPQERPQNGGGGGQGPSTPQLLAYVYVKGGKPIPSAGDMPTVAEFERYVGDSLYKGNEAFYGADLDREKAGADGLLESALKGLRVGVLTPWAPFTELPPADAELQKAEFAITPPPPGSPSDAQATFTINGKSYDPDTNNITRQVNTVDNWTLTAKGEPHIFHIHVNPFEVVDVTTSLQNGQQISIFDENGNCIPQLVDDKDSIANQYCGMHHIFKDTIFVEPNYQVHIRTKYDRYIGEYVIHCHILDHEDAGMMLNVNIVPDVNAARGGLGMAMHHRADAGMPGMTGMEGMSAKP